MNGAMKKSRGHGSVAGAILGTVSREALHESGRPVEVAEAIARSLQKRGLQVDLRPAAEVDEIDPHQAVVLGGSLYFGRCTEMR